MRIQCNVAFFRMHRLVLRRIMQAANVDREQAVLSKLSVDRAHVDITRWESDQPLVMAYRNQFSLCIPRNLT